MVLNRKGQVNEHLLSVYLTSVSVLQAFYITNIFKGYLWEIMNAFDAKAIGGLACT